MRAPVSPRLESTEHDLSSREQCEEAQAVQRIGHHPPAETARHREPVGATVSLTKEMIFYDSDISAVGRLRSKVAGLSNGRLEIQMRDLK